MLDIIQGILFGERGIIVHGITMQGMSIVYVVLTMVFLISGLTGTQILH